MKQSSLLLPALLCFLLMANGIPASTAAPTDGGGAAGAARAIPAPVPGEPVTHVDITHVTTLRGRHINSPKSVIFSPDGSCFYINSLEGLETVVYDAATLQQTAVIRHEFGPEDADLFLNGENTAFDYAYHVLVPEDERNCFGGKPVECAFSHDGRYLWITYYRRTWDRRASSPSAVAILDTQTNRLVRVMPTGPLPKMIVPSPDGRTMAIIHWGDNTIGLIDMSSDNPADFFWTTRLTDGRRLGLDDIAGDRDKMCGWCLRGAAFSADGRWLFVGRMHDGGISVFDLASNERIGVFRQIAATPRHIVLSHDGSKLYVTSNVSGVVSELDVAGVLADVQGKRDKPYRGRSLQVGRQARTLTQTPDGRLLLVACNVSHELVVVDIADWKKIASHRTWPYTVGLAVNPAGDMVLTSSQGRDGRGGHAVDVFRLSPPAGPDPRTVPQPTAPAMAEAPETAASDTPAESPAAAPDETPEATAAASAATAMDTSAAASADPAAGTMAADPTKAPAETPLTSEATSTETTATSD